MGRPGYSHAGKSKMTKKKENFLLYVPEHNMEWSRGDNGLVTLVKERTKSRLIKKMIDWLKRSQVFYIDLDKFGSAVWLAIDGKRTVAEICGMVKEQFGEELVQAEQRISQYMGMLKRNDFIEFV